MAEKITKLSNERTRRSGAIDLTKARIAALQPRVGRYHISDAKETGLIVRVYPGGAKAYYATGRVGSGRTAPRRNVKIADVDSINLIEARRRARELLTEMASGVDPNAAKIQGSTLSDILSRYDQHLKREGTVKRRDVVRSLRFNLKKQLALPAADLSRVIIVDRMGIIADSGKLGASQYFRKCTVAFLNWAVNSGYLETNPMIGYREARSTRARRMEKTRLTFTTPEQIKAFWMATEAASNPAFRDLLRFLLLTGQRRTETAVAGWQNIDDGIWVIPALVTKTGSEQRVPLSVQSLELIADQPRYAASDLMFPGRHGGPMSGWTQLLAPVREAMGEPTFAPHALRRTFRTGIEELGTPHTVCELMIGHKRDDLTEIYSRAELWEKRQAAQKKWEAHIAEIVA